MPQKKPIYQLQNEGTYRADRHASRGDEPEAVGEVLSVDWGEDLYAQWLWELLLPMAEQVGGGEVDTVALCGCCQWYSRYRETMARLETVEPGAALYLTIQKAASTAWKNFLEIARGYGLTPQDRIKLAKPLPVEEEIDPLEALAGAMSDN